MNNCGIEVAFGILDLCMKMRRMRITQWFQNSVHKYVVPSCVFVIIKLCHFNFTSFSFSFSFYFVEKVHVMRGLKSFILG